MKSTFPKLYKKSSKGQLQEWEIFVEDAEITVMHGLQDGKKQTDKKLIKKGKNIGKENERTPHVQAVSEAESKWKKQLDKGYVDDLDCVDDVVYLPMLAHPFSKIDKGKEKGRKKHIQYPAIAQRKFDGCLHYDTLVMLKGVGLVKIGEIVEGKCKGKIKSYNTKTGKVEYKEIKNVFVNGIDIKEHKYQWYEIETESGCKIKITGNHRVWLPDLECYRRVDELKGDERFLVEK